MIKCVHLGDALYIFDNEVTFDEARKELHRIYPGDNFLDKDEHPDDSLFEDFGNGKSGLVDVGHVKLDVSSAEDYE
jgi:hypothetical protein